MDAFALPAENRDQIGRSGARAARREGRIPAVVYGKRIDAQALSVGRREFGLLERSEGGTNALIQLEIAGASEPTMVLVREIQRQPVNKEPVHIDFIAIAMDEAVQVTVPLHFEGEPKGIEEGGVPQYVLYELQVSCLPGNIPVGISIDVSGLGLNDTLTAREVAMPEGVELVTDPDEAVVTVTLPAMEVEETEEAEGEAAEGELAEGEEAAEGEEPAGEAEAGESDE